MHDDVDFRATERSDEVPLRESAANGVPAAPEPEEFTAGDAAPEPDRGPLAAGALDSATDADLLDQLVDVPYDDEDDH